MANKIFQRPQKLSDPFRDFSQEELQQIINTKDNQMGFHELNCLFNSFLPAGTYDEVVYFFPIALDYVFKKKEEWFTLFDNLLTWVMVHRECLEKDELLNDYWAKISREIKLILHAPFVVTKENLYPRDAIFFEAVDDGIQKCLKFFNQDISTVLKLEDLFIHRFKQISSYNCAAWFIYLGNHYSHLINSCDFSSQLRQVALDFIYEKVLSDELHCSFWDKELRYSFD